LFPFASITAVAKEFPKHLYYLPLKNDQLVIGQFLLAEYQTLSKVATITIKDALEHL
jgi:hypothetical protein